MADAPVYMDPVVGADFLGLGYGDQAQLKADYRPDLINRTYLNTLKTYFCSQVSIFYSMVVQITPDMYSEIWRSHLWICVTVKTSIS